MKRGASNPALRTSAERTGCSSHVTGSARTGAVARELASLPDPRGNWIESERGNGVEH